MACRVVLSATGTLELQKATRDCSTRINKQTKIHIYLVHSLHKQRKKHKSKITSFKKRRKKTSLNRNVTRSEDRDRRPETKPNNFVAYVYICTVSSISSSRQKGKRKEPSRPHHVSHLVQNPNPTNVRGDDVYVIYILTSFSNPKEKKKQTKAHKKKNTGTTEICNVKTDFLFHSYTNRSGKKYVGIFLGGEGGG